MLLPGGVQSRVPGNSSGSDDVTVSVLICLLLLLLVLLFMAWHWLNRKIEGRYHPQRLMRRLVFQGQQFWGDLAQRCQDEPQNDEEPQRYQGEERGEEEEAGQLSQHSDQEQEEELTEPASPEAAVQEALEEDEASKAAGGSVEALLSDLHSSSGTAAWEDSSHQLHATTAF